MAYRKISSKSFFGAFNVFRTQVHTVITQTWLCSHFVSTNELVHSSAQPFSHRNPVSRAPESPWPSPRTPPSLCPCPCSSHCPDWFYNPQVPVLNRARTQGLKQICTLLRETHPFSWPTCQQIWKDRIEEREKDFCISSPHALFMSVCKVSFAKSPAHRRFQKRGELAFKEGSWPFVMMGCCEP